MTPFGAKSIWELTWADIESVVEAGLPESEELEFKQGLSTARGQPDAWDAGGSVSNRARDRLVEEVIAFANAYGGTLLLGIEESEEKPPRAAGISPLPRAADLADALRNILRDCVDPPLPQSDVTSVQREAGKGDGVVVVAVPQSRLRPHRSKQTKESLFRRGDRAEPMGMREIQDLVLLSGMESQAIEAAFGRHANEFKQVFAGESRREGGGLASFQIVALPAAQKAIKATAVRAAALQFEVATYVGTLRGNGVRMEVPAWGSSRRPVLGGARWTHGEGFCQAVREIYWTGGVVSRVATPWEASGEGLPMAWVAAELLNVLQNVERVRIAGEVPSMEYGVQIEVRSRPVPIRFGPLFPHWVHRRTMEVAEPHLRLPRFSYQGPGEASTLVALALRDLHEAAGHEFVAEEWAIVGPLA